MTTDWHNLTPAARREVIFRLNGTIHDMQADGDEEEIAALQALVRMIDGSSSPPPPSPPAGFLGERLAPIATASDADHHVAVVPYRFATDGGIALYVELHETHDGARPGRVMALSTLVHLCQNVGEDEVWQIGGRETPGPRATLARMSLPTLDAFTSAFYQALVHNPDPEKAPRWEALTPEQQAERREQAKTALLYIGAPYEASPGSPPPTEPTP